MPIPDILQSSVLLILGCESGYALWWHGDERGWCCLIVRGGRMWGILPVLPKITRWTGGAWEILYPTGVYQCVAVSHAEAESLRAASHIVVPLGSQAPSSSSSFCAFWHSSIVILACTTHRSNTYCPQTNRRLLPCFEKHLVEDLARSVAELMEMNA